MNPNNKRKIFNRTLEDEDYIMYTESSKRRRVTKRYIASGSWSLKENSIYLEFLETHQNLFENEFVRRSSKVFRKMSSLLRRRDPEQCRSHHQKLGLRFGSDLSKIIDHLQKKTGKRQENEMNKEAYKFKKSEIKHENQEKKIKSMATGHLNEDLQNGFKITNPRRGQIQIVINLDDLQTW